MNRITGKFASLVSNTFEIKSDEVLKVSLLFVNFFLIVSCYYVCKSIRGALVIQKLGADFLPYIWTIGVIGLVVFVGFYSKLIDRVTRQRVTVITSMFFIVTLGIITYFLRVESAWVTVSFYIWGDIFSVVMIEQFWSHCNDMYKPSEAKRLYGLVGSGGILGGLVGGGIVGSIVQTVGTHSMPYVCMVAIGLVIIINFVVNRVSGASSLALNMHSPVRSKDRPNTENIKPKKSAPFWEGVTLIRKNRVLMFIGLALVFAQVSSTLIDFQFNKAVEASLSGLDDKSAFFGKFYFLLNLVSLIVMLFFTSPIHKKMGVVAGLLVHPLLITLGLVLLIVFPAPFLVLGLKLTDKSLGYSIARGSREVVYTETTREEKYKAKAVIDMLGYRASKVLGSALIIPFLAYFPIYQLNFVNLALTFSMVVTIMFLKTELKTESEIKEIESEMDYGLKQAEGAIS